MRKVLIYNVFIYIDIYLELKLNNRYGFRMFFFGFYVYCLKRSRVYV